MTQMQREHLTVRREKAVLVSCLLPTGGPRGPSALATTDPHDPLSELRSLADTAGALVVDELLQKKQKPDPATFIGKGKVGELAQMMDLHGADVAIFDNDLSPSQIGNIEQRIEAKVHSYVILQHAFQREEKERRKRKRKEEKGKRKNDR